MRFRIKGMAAAMPFMLGTRLHVFRGGSADLIGAGTGRLARKDNRRVVFPPGIGLRDPRSQKRDLGHPSVSTQPVNDYLFGGGFRLVVHRLEVGAVQDAIARIAADYVQQLGCFAIVVRCAIGAAAQSCGGT
jgi:hypothetical protein